MTSVIEEAKISYSLNLFRLLSQHGDRVALVEDSTGRTLTYAELVSAVEKVSSALNRRGLKTPDMVSIVGPSCIDMVILQYAILSTGAAVTFTKPTYTEYELSQHYADCQPRFVFTSPDLLKKVENASKLVTSCEQIFLLWKDSNDESTQSYENFQDFHLDNGSLSTLFDENIVKDAMNHVAYVPYSSGTTGLPKGVMWSHYGMNCGMDLIKSLKWPTDVQITLGLQSPLFHASGIQSVGFSLLGGIKTVILPPFDPSDTSSFLRRLSEHKINRIFIPPYIIVALLKYEHFEQFDLRYLMAVVSGAAAISDDVMQSLAEALRRANSHAIVTQSYGLTECCILPLYWPMDASDRPKNKDSIGSACPGVEIKVVADNEGAALGPNVIGKIWIRHSGIMLGYRNNERATENTLTSDGWLITGDVGYYDENGYFYIEGREKELFKCRGNQVSPAEIEIVLQSHPKVKDAAVIGVPHDVMDEVAMAFVVKNDERLTEDDLHRLVEDKLASFKHLHGGLRFVEKIPRNALGKVLRNELQQMSQNGST